MVGNRRSGDVDADVIIVGSGFGGAVAAARLAQAGYSVLVLERGRRWNAGDFPRDPRLRDGWLWGVDGGLDDIPWLEGMISVQASGWGGGSLAYANVFSRPFDAALSSRWPAHLRRPELDLFYDLAAHMLEVSPSGIRGLGFTRLRRIRTTLRFLTFFVRATLRRSRDGERVAASSSPTVGEKT